MFYHSFARQGINKIVDTNLVESRNQILALDDSNTNGLPLCGEESI